MFFREIGWSALATMTGSGTENNYKWPFALTSYREVLALLFAQGEREGRRAGAESLEDTAVRPLLDGAFVECGDKIVAGEQSADRKVALAVRTAGHHAA